MNNNVFVKAWNVLYPILIYYAVSNVVIYLAVLALGITAQEYGNSYMMLQTMAAAVSLPVLFQFYRRDKLMFTVFHQRTTNELKETGTQKKVQNGVLMLLGGALAGIALNNIISATGLMQHSQVYQNVTSQFFAGDVLFEVLGAGIIVPVAEELLYRGLVYARLCDWIGIRPAIAVSSLIFGALHFNMVQFIYAAVLGLMLAYFLEKSHNLYGAVLGHIGANLLTVLRVETGIFDWMEKSRSAYWLTTVLFAVISILILFYLSGLRFRKKNS